jgi:hypothetical protein
MTTIARRSSRWTPLGVAALILGFLVWWPLGFAVLAYILWGGSVDQLLSDTIDQFKTKSALPAAPAMPRSTITGPAR